MEKFYAISIFVLCGALVNVFSMPSGIDQNSNIKPYGSLADTINQTIEGLRNDLPENLTFPGQVDITIPDDLVQILNGSLSISDLTIEGIKGFLVPYLDVSTSRARLTFVLPNIDVTAGYIADLTILGQMPVYGNGSVFIGLYDLQIKIDAGLTLIPMQITDLSLDIELEKIQFDIEGIAYDEETSQAISALVTSIANDVIVPYINDNSKEIGETLSGPIKDLINGLLNPTTTAPPASSPSN